jgi:RNase H-fold protein (predicted Holliday junction resolvase)
MNIKIIGLDISKRRIGISIGIQQNNNNKIIPLKVIEEYSDFIVIETLKKLKKDYSPNNFVIGLPSKSYENAKFIKHFVHKYREYLKPFIYQNEDYTTFLSNLDNSNDNINNKKKYQPNRNLQNDHISASIILERFFNC